MSRGVAVSVVMALLVAAGLVFSQMLHTGRSPANVNQSSSQQILVDEITSRIIAMRTKADIDSVREEILALASKHQDKIAVQVFAAVFEILPIFKGVLWRLRGLVEENDAIHLLALGKLRGFYHNLYAYGPHMKALFNYLADPPDKAGKFHQVSDFQDFLYYEARGPLVEVRNKLELALREVPSKHFEFEFDRSLLRGVGDNVRLLDPEQAVKTVIKPHFSYILAFVSRLVGTIEYLYIYNYDDTLRILGKMLKESAINQTFNRFRIVSNYVLEAQGKEISLPHITGRKRFFELVNSYPKLLRARFNRNMAEPILKSSYQNFKLTAQHRLKAYTCSIEYPYNMVRGLPVDESYACDGAFMRADGFRAEESFVVGGSSFLINPNRLLLRQDNKLRRMTQKVRIFSQGSDDDVITVVSNVTGEPIKISARHAFKYHRSLRKFLPIAFNSVNRFEDGTVISGRETGKELKNKKWAWNYGYGKPTAWGEDAVTFGGVFPGLTNKNIYRKMASIKLTPELQPFGRIFTTVPMGLPSFFAR